MTVGIVQAGVVLRRLQESLGCDTITSKSSFLCKLEIAFDELASRSSDPALGTRAVENPAAGITLLLWRAGCTTPLRSIRFHEPICLDVGKTMMCRIEERYVEPHRPASLLLTKVALFRSMSVAIRIPHRQGDPSRD